MPALIAGSAVRTCLGDGAATFARLLRGVSGIRELRDVDRAKLNVERGSPIEEVGAPGAFRASRWLACCVRQALDEAGDGARSGRVVAVVGTGLRELPAVERWALGGEGFETERLHFAAAVRQAAPAVSRVVTLSNACSAGGHALAVAQDLVELGEADCVVAAAADAMTESMLAMIGRVSDGPARDLRPFDAGRTGTLLGEGAAAVVVVPEGRCARPLARLLGTGLACDAHHETAPDVEGVRRALRDAFRRAGRPAAAVDLVVAHGTATARNDPLEIGVIREAVAPGDAGPLVTAIKGAIGHTSGSAALHGLDVAIRCLASGVVPPIAGLRTPLAEAGRARLVMGAPARASLRLAQVDAFGFGGVNSVSVVEAVR